MGFQLRLKRLPEQPSEAEVREWVWERIPQFIVHTLARDEQKLNRNRPTLTLTDTQGIPQPDVEALVSQIAAEQVRLRPSGEGYIFEAPTRAFAERLLAHTGRHLASGHTLHFTEMEKHFAV